MKLRGGAQAFKPGSGQRSYDICTMRGSDRGSIGEPPRSKKCHRRIESGVPPEGLYRAKVLDRDLKEVPERVLNAIRCDHELTKCSHWHNLSQSRC
jgi:hypothetical protein